MKKTKFTFGRIIATLSLIGFATCVALADTQIIPATIKTVTAGGCIGKYYAYAKMTNGTGLIWITPPTNISSGTFTDASGFAAPYTSVATVMRNDTTVWCGTNSVTFPATNTSTYQLMVVVKSTLPPPTNGQPLTLQIHWQ